MKKRIGYSILKGKSKVLTTISLVLCILFSSCNKKEFISNATSTINPSELSNEEILNNWSKAHSGRWLPYVIRKAGDSGKLKNLEIFSNSLTPINAAKYYYKTLLQQRLGYSDSMVDDYLKRYYYANHESINNALKYRKTLDSLYIFYENLYDETKNSKESSTKKLSYSPGINTKIRNVSLLKKFI